MWYGWFAYTLPKEYLLPSLTEVYVCSGCFLNRNYFKGT